MGTRATATKAMRSKRRMRRPATKMMAPCKNIKRASMMLTSLSERRGTWRNRRIHARSCRRGTCRRRRPFPCPCAGVGGPPGPRNGGGSGTAPGGRSCGRRGRLAGRTAPVNPSVRRMAKSRRCLMTAASLSLEEPPGQLVPVVLVESSRDAVHRRSAVLQYDAELRREALGELPRRGVEEPAGRVAREKVLEVAGQPARLDLHEPAGTVWVAQRGGRMG